MRSISPGTFSPPLKKDQIDLVFIRLKTQLFFFDPSLLLSGVWCAKINSGKTRKLEHWVCYSLEGTFDAGVCGRNPSPGRRGGQLLLLLMREKNNKEMKAQACTEMECGKTWNVQYDCLGCSASGKCAWNQLASSIVGSVVECSPASRAARVRFPDDAPCHMFGIVKLCHLKVHWDCLT